MKTEIDSSTQAGDSRSELEHPGDSPEKTPEESSWQSKLEKQLEMDTDMIAASAAPHSIAIFCMKEIGEEKRWGEVDGILNAGVLW